MSPGPNTFIVTRLALAEGRRPAAVAVLGIALGNCCWLALVLGGAHLLFERVPGLATGLRFAGGVYLGWLGFRILGATARGEDVLARVDEPAPAVSSFRAGLITSLTNPNTLPFYLSLLGVTFARGVSGWVPFAASGGVLALCVLWYGGLAVGLSSESVRAGYRRWTKVINLSLAGLLFAFAVRLLVVRG